MFHPPLSPFVLETANKPLCSMARKGQGEGEEPEEEK